MERRREVEGELAARRVGEKEKKPRTAQKERCREVEKERRRGREGETEEEKRNHFEVIYIV